MYKKTAKNQPNLAFLSNFFEKLEKMLPNSGFCPKNVAKNPDFFVVKNQKNEKVAKIGVLPKSRVRLYKIQNRIQTFT